MIIIEVQKMENIKLYMKKERCGSDPDMIHPMYPSYNRKLVLIFKINKILSEWMCSLDLSNSVSRSTIYRQCIRC